MKDHLLIRESMQDDLTEIEVLYPQAFPDEDLVPLVRELLNDSSNVVSLVALIDSQIAGHVIFTRCDIAGSPLGAALLGPLAVNPAWQRRGIGSEIVREGIRRMAATGIDFVCVLGDPKYYERFGFAPEPSVEPPYELPPEWSGAWQSRRTGVSSTAIAGRLLVPEEWMKPSLWAP